MQEAPADLREHATIALEHLISRGVVTTGEILSRPIRLAGLASRNVVLLVELPSRSLIYKEFRPIFPLGSHRGAREYNFLQLLSECAYRGVLLDFAPRLVDYHAGSGRLLVEAIETAATSHELLLSDLAVSRGLFGAIGAKLGELHRLQRSQHASSPVEEAEVPFLLGVDRPDFGVTARTAEAEDLLKSLAEDNEAGSLFARAGEAWKIESAIHGDLRLANVVIQRRDRMPRLIDWENAGWGDPMWDLGAFFGSVTYALGDRSRDVTDAMDLAKPGFDELLEAYGPVDKAQTEKAALFAAVAFLQFAFEDAQAGACYYTSAAVTRNALEFYGLCAGGLFRHG